MTQVQMFHNQGNGHLAGSGRYTERAAKAGRAGESVKQPSASGQFPEKVGDTIGNIDQAQSVVTGAQSESAENERVRLFGRIGRYFGVKQTQSGVSLTTFSMAIKRPYKDQSGNWLQGTVWVRVVVWEAEEALGQELRKGARVSVDGKLKTREWFDRQNKPHTTTELVAREVRFLDTPGSGVVQHP